MKRRKARLTKREIFFAKLMEKKSTSATTCQQTCRSVKRCFHKDFGCVSSLQFHDKRVNRIEHVVETLNDIKVMGSSGEKKKNVVTALMGRIGDLQIHQLKNARRKSFMSAVRRVYC
jgi:hypothetical protein